MSAWVDFDEDIAPTSGSWLGQPMPGAVVRITLRGSELHDLSQLSGHPAADKIAELGRELAQVDASLNTHEEQWLLLSEEIEAAGG